MPPYQLKVPYICDVYEKEAPIDWAGMNPKPYRTILKASGKFTDGVRRQDHEVENYVAQCKDLGIRYGLYHFLRPDNIAEQAQLYWDLWTKVGGADMPPIVDVEIELKTLKKKKGKKFGGEDWAYHIKTWLSLIENWSGQKPVIYTSQRYWIETFDRLGNPPAWTDEYPLWVAWYPDKEFVDANSAPPKSLMPAGWTKWALWQYSETGIADGYLANDLNAVSPEFAAALDAQVSLG